MQIHPIFIGDIPIWIKVADQTDIDIYRSQQTKCLLLSTLHFGICIVLVFLDFYVFTLCEWIMSSSCDKIGTVFGGYSLYICP